VGYQPPRARLQFLDIVALDREIAARGAVAGALAAGVWAAQSPLDARVFRVPYLDHELLGKLVTRGRGWLPVGVALHIANGALFGAAYAHVARRLPGPAWARGPLAGLAEHLATWPLTALVDRYHPARDELPPLAAEPRAFVQATWRHLLFGVVLGEVERRLNAPPAPTPPSAPVMSSNGHGNIEHAAAGSKR
jgi:hypothetical protein